MKKTNKKPNKKPIKTSKKEEIKTLKKQRDLLLCYLDAVSMRCIGHEIGTKQNASNETGLMIVNIAFITDALSITKHFGAYFLSRYKDTKVSLENVKDYKEDWNKFATEKVVPQFQKNIQNLQSKDKQKSPSYVS